MSLTTGSQNDRPSREVIHMLTAFLWSTRSQDPRLKVGAVVTSQDLRRVLSIGYNGPAKGLPESFISAEPGNSKCLHAEENALLLADCTIPNKVIFITDSPCLMCAQRIVNAGFSRVVWARKYRDESGLKILESCGVAHEQLPISQSDLPWLLHRVVSLFSRVE